MPSSILDLAERQHGLITRRQVRREADRSARSARFLADSPRWESLTDEVLRLRGTPAGRGQRAMAAVLDAGPGAALGFRSGANWWGVRGAALEPIHVVRTSRSRRSSQLVTVHTVRRLPAEFITELDGIPIARPELIALHLFATEHERRAERWVETMWSSRLLDGRSIARLLASLGRRGRNGTAGLRAYLDERGPGYVPAASGIEARALQILREAGIVLDRQVDSGDEVWTGRVDLRHPVLPVIVEVQSERHHTALVDRRADEARLGRLRDAGFTVVQVTDVEVWTHPAAAVARVAAAIAAARRGRAS